MYIQTYVYTHVHIRFVYIWYGWALVIQNHLSPLIPSSKRAEVFDVLRSTALLKGDMRVFKNRRQ